MNRQELIDRICITDISVECSKEETICNCEKCDRKLNAWFDEYDKQVRFDFAEKIRAHMTKYCHARLEQQYCAMEVIDFIGKLLGEKDFSIDVEKEMADHDKKVRNDAIEEFVKECEKMKGWINTASSPMSFIYEIAKQMKGE